MKKLIFSIIFIIPLGLFSVNAGGLMPSKTNTESIGTLKSLKMPFSATGKVTMEMVYKNGQYSLWRCENYEVNQYPGTGLTGITYKYFVYKNEKYHLAVKENNKDDIFRYFSGTK